MQQEGVGNGVVWEARRWAGDWQGAKRERGQEHVVRDGLAGRVVQIVAFGEREIQANTKVVTARVWRSGAGRKAAVKVIKVPSKTKKHASGRGSRTPNCRYWWGGSGGDTSKNV